MNKTGLSKNILKDLSATLKKISGLVSLLQAKNFSLQEKPSFMVTSNQLKVTDVKDKMLKFLLLPLHMLS